MDQLTFAFYQLLIANFALNAYNALKYTPKTYADLKDYELHKKLDALMEQNQAENPDGHSNPELAEVLRIYMIRQNHHDVYDNDLNLLKQTKPGQPLFDEIFPIFLKSGRLLIEEKPFYLSRTIKNELDALTWIMSAETVDAEAKARAVKPLAAQLAGHMMQQEYKIFVQDEAFTFVELMHADEPELTIQAAEIFLECTDRVSAESVKEMSASLQKLVGWLDAPEYAAIHPKLDRAIADNMKQVADFSDLKRLETQANEAKAVIKAAPFGSAESLAAAEAQFAYWARNHELTNNQVNAGKALAKLVHAVPDGHWLQEKAVPIVLECMEYARSLEDHSMDFPHLRIHDALTRTEYNRKPKLGVSLFVRQLITDYYLARIDKFSETNPDKALSAYWAIKSDDYDCAAVGDVAPRAAKIMAARKALPAIDRLATDTKHEFYQTNLKKAVGYCRGILKDFSDQPDLHAAVLEHYKKYNEQLAEVHPAGAADSYASAVMEDFYTSFPGGEELWEADKARMHIVAKRIAQNPKLLNQIKAPRDPYDWAAAPFLKAQLPEKIAILKEFRPEPEPAVSPLRGAGRRLSRLFTFDQPKQ